MLTFINKFEISQLIVVFAIIAAAFAGQEASPRVERQAVVSYSGYPYTGYSGVYAPAVSTYSAYPTAYSAYPSAYYGGVYGGVPVARAFF